MKYDNIKHTKASLKTKLESVKDPRSSRGTRYPISFLLNSAACAVMNGATNFVQIADWVEGQTLAKLRRLGNTRADRPVESTFRRALSKIEIEELKREIYSWFEGSTTYSALAVDGKTLCGSRDEDGKQPHFLSMTTHGEGITIGDRQVPGKKSEIKEIRPLLETVDIKGKVITADALHSTKDFGQYLVSREADYVYLVKGNRKKLITRLDMMDIENCFDSRHKTLEKAHGRLEQREIYLTSEIPWWLRYESAKQAFLIKRETTILKTNKIRTEVVYGLTSLGSEEADAEKILEINRGHWTIENKVFHVRDVTFNEDRSRFRVGSLPAVMILLKNTAMNLFRKMNKTNMAKAIRECIYGGNLDIQILSKVF